VGQPLAERHHDLEQIRLILHKAKEMDSLNWIFFEGGEPFLYYPV